VAVGETQEQPFQLSFNSALKVDFQGSRVTSDGGLVLVRELGERLGFGELIARHLAGVKPHAYQRPCNNLIDWNIGNAGLDSPAKQKESSTVPLRIL
jgi:hypothetical protein